MIMFLKTRCRSRHAGLWPDMEIPDASTVGSVDPTYVPSAALKSTTGAEASNSE